MSSPTSADGWVPVIVRADPDEPGAAQVLVVVTVCGQPYEFLLDTGAAGSRIVADPLTTRSTIDRMVPAGSSGLLGAGTSRRRALLAEVVLGPIRRTGLEVDLAEPGHPGPASILGMDVLRDHRLDIDLAAGRLGIDNTALIHPLPLTVSSHGHPYLDLAWDAVAGRAIWDTGAGLSVVDRSFAGSHPDVFVPAGHSVGTDSEGNSAATPLVTMAGCVIGGRAFGPTPAAVVDLAAIRPADEPAFDLLLGYPVIAQAAWQIDVPNRRWALR